MGAEESDELVRAAVCFETTKSPHEVFFSSWGLLTSWKPISALWRQLAICCRFLFACHLLFLCLDHFFDHIAANGTILLRG